ncbi:MAG: 4-(cytidine 5'-diphospho)-2-C-methyl-D-erythritol kinase [Lachnospiraceae bacterium]
MQLKALAKINLGLDILHKRDDGYHEVRMVMQTIHMYDTINMYLCDTPGIHLKANLPYIPTDERNLVYRTARMLMDEFDIQSGVHIDLRKLIPVSAGMAGGSSDAAATMVGINRLFKLGLSSQELMVRAKSIGADVPYCVLRGTALAEGIGEILTPLAPMPFCYVLAATPKIIVSTKTAYENLELAKIKHHPDIDEIVAGIHHQDLHRMAKAMGNVFEEGLIPQFPVIGTLKEFMLHHGALNAMMSGSGPTVFGIFEDNQVMQKAARKLKKKQLARKVFATRIFNNKGGAG